MEPTNIIDAMMEKDEFSRWLGIERLAEGPGYCTLQLQVRDEMCNGFGIAHGGITYSLADSALAFASNSRGRHALSIETSINHVKPLKPGDTITAKATELSRTNKLGIYEVRVERQHELVALFKGTVFVKDTIWT